MEKNQKVVSTDLLSPFEKNTLASQDKMTTPADDIDQVLKKASADTTRRTHEGTRSDRYLFDRDSIQGFWAKFLPLNESKGSVPHLFETPGMNCNVPLIINVNLQISDTNSHLIVNEKLYMPDDIPTAVSYAQSVVRSIVDKVSDENLTCIVTSKKAVIPQSRGFLDSFTMHFPNLLLKPSAQDTQVCPRIEAQLKRVFGVDFFVQRGVYKKPIPVTRYDMFDTIQAFDYTSEPIPLHQAVSSFYNPGSDTPILVTAENAEYYIPRMLSTLRADFEGVVPLFVKPGIKAELVTKVDKMAEVWQEKKETYHDTLGLTAQLMPLISPARAKSEPDFLCIGRALWTITRGTTQGYEMWCEFSSKENDSHDEAKCTSFWQEFTTNDFGIHTLRHYAQVDSLTEYVKIKKERCMRHIDNCMNGEDYTMAKIIYEHVAPYYKCASISGKVWYKFNGRIWENIDDGHTLRNVVSEDIWDMCKERLTSLFANMKDAPAKGGKDAVSGMIKLISELRKSGFKRSVMASCADIFYDKDFDRKLDQNPNLIAFMNGVYDLKHNVFRDGRPDDYLSKCLPMPYIEYDPEDQRVKDVIQFFEKVFPDPELRKYFLDTHCNIFEGGNPLKHIYVWSGPLGNNAKSVTSNFFKQMLGPFCITFNTKMMTGDRVNVGAANADLARASGGVRMATMDEPGKDEMLQIGQVKLFTGNDPVFARDLFQRGKDVREFTPMFKSIFICNDLPRINGADQATWNRMKVIPFESNFVVDGYPATLEEQMEKKIFPADPYFSRRLPDLVSALAWVLLEHRKNLQYIREPEKVKMAVSAYRKANDIYRQFVEENLVEDESKKISVKKLYEAFKEWHREAFPHRTLPIQAEVESHYTKIWGEAVGTPHRSWSGRALRTMEINPGFK